MQPGSHRGLGRYSRALRAAAHELGRFDVVEYQAKGRRGRLDDWLDIPGRAWSVARHGAYFHATSPYQLVPTRLRSTAVSMLDAIPLDLPAYRQTGVKADFFYGLATQCAVIVTLSHHGAERIQQLLDVPAAHIVSAPLPMVPARVSESAPCRCALAIEDFDQYVTSLIDLSTDDPRKRLPWILGMAEPLRCRGIRLVLTGNGTRSLTSGNVVGTGRLCDRHMHALFAGARCFVSATAYEGQGLPPQEALSEGTPVVAFRNTSLPEMLGDGALWLDEPAGSWGRLTSTAGTDVASSELTDAVLALCEDQVLRDRLGAAGRHHVMQFTQKRFTESIGRAYDLLTDRSGGPGNAPRATQQSSGS